MMFMEESSHLSQLSMSVDYNSKTAVQCWDIFDFLSTPSQGFKAQVARKGLSTHSQLFCCDHPIPLSSCSKACSWKQVLEPWWGWPQAWGETIWEHFWEHWKHDLRLGLEVMQLLKRPQNEEERLNSWRTAHPPTFQISPMFILLQKTIFLAPPSSTLVHFWKLLFVDSVSAAVCTPSRNSICSSG